VKKSAGTGAESIYLWVQSLYGGAVDLGKSQYQRRSGSKIVSALELNLCPARTALLHAKCHLALPRRGLVESISICRRLLNSPMDVTGLDFLLIHCCRVIPCVVAAADVWGGATSLATLPNNPPPTLRHFRGVQYLES